MRFSDTNPTLWITSSDEDTEDEYRLRFRRERERKKERERVRELRRNGRERLSDEIQVVVSSSS